MSAPRYPSFKRHLMLTTVLTSLAPVVTAEPAVAQNYCTISNGVCTFSNGTTSSAPFTVDAFGTDGSGSTSGTPGGSFTVDVESNVDVTAPPESAFTLMVDSRGGEGSTDGHPSSGGAGGDLVINPPSSMRLTLSEAAPNTDLTMVEIISQGGNGNDDNKNNDNDGGDGGSAGSITYNGQSALTALSATFGGQQAPDAAYAVELLSQGGQGGRGNEGGGKSPTGGAGGNAGSVTGTIGEITVGDDDYSITATSVMGLRAHSIGGNGPDDYNSSNGKTQGGGGASFGGSAGEVDVTVDGLVNVIGRSTDGAVRAVDLRSVGGNGGWSYDNGDLDSFTPGGNGGEGSGVKFSLAGSILAQQTGNTASTYPSAAVYALSAGGTGGVGQSREAGGLGGNGDWVNIDITNQAQNAGATPVHAIGTAVDAIIALSTGGVGGAGLESAQGSDGGVGGDGGAVTVDVDLEDGQTIFAQASGEDFDSGRGIVAQSIGNYGGAGGDGNVVFGLSGGAGKGGDGGTVDVTVNGGTIATQGTADIREPVPYGYAIVAQSIGGGGGTGGSINGLFGGPAGAGGKGGDGDDVTVTNAGTIAAQGVMASGILAQSIGGGGGAGGVSSSDLVALGGSGGDGGQSGTVTVTNTGSVTTDGFGASGLLAQSIVGAGGAAGVAEGAYVSIGATGGSDTGIAPGAVTVSNTGTVAATGDVAIGIHAQSVGGGGGSAVSVPGSDETTGVYTLGVRGGQGGDGGPIDITDMGTVTTSGIYSHGVLAHSVGGGGGNGGSAFSSSVLGPGIGAAALGGQSGGGGDGGTVDVTPAKAFSVTTAGDASVGVAAQSVGGGGGTGGDATTTTGLKLVQMGIGGVAGSGGAGGDVAVTLGDGMIATENNRGTGVLAQSVGGGGGLGGSATSKATGLLSLGFAAGGFGGDGGEGGSASATLSGTTVKTATQQDTGTANDAVGVLIQSVGGGGGIGGGAFAKAFTTGIPVDPEDPEQTFNANLQASLGGGGGSGGHGGAATATFDGGAGITTNGAGSHGVLAQSVGGGGGHGGDASTTTNELIGGTVKFTFNAALGGRGGDGGGGGATAVTVGSSTPSPTPTTITTTGQYANAIMAQSIGGGGGSSGLPTSNTRSFLGDYTVDMTFDVGALELKKSSLGADGGSTSVTLHADSALDTEGDGSRGVVAQSIGGGGGTVQGSEVQLSGAFSIGGGEEEEEEETAFYATVTVNLGQRGGAGGDGGGVDIATTAGGTVTTAGIDADGLFAQSIGGGGGLAGSLGSAKPTSDSDLARADPQDLPDRLIDINPTISVGGRGGTGGNGGTVTVDHGGAIATIGDWSDGIVAQSLGGGGGTGATASTSGAGVTPQITIGVGGKGGSGGDGGAVDIDFTPDTTAPVATVSTTGYMAHGVLLQSIGGGGGQGGDGSDTAGGVILVGGGAGSGVGGKGGTAGSGDKITANGTVAIATRGADAHGLVAQSIGGGGGIGGNGSSNSSEGGTGMSVDINVGGGGGTAGSGGTVDLEFAPTITTSGNRAFGLVAQSIGGGGGIGGSGSADNTASVSVGGSGGTGSNGGEVSLTLQGGSITTSGDGAHGIVAQSIGGGGGIGGDVGTKGINIGRLANGGAGDGNIIATDIDTAVTTTGAAAHGIVAQSIGGGGGMQEGSAGVLMGASGGSGSADVVAMIQSAPVSATGSGSYGIVAQSTGASGNSEVALTVESDVTGGTDGGAAIAIIDGYKNSIEIAKGNTVQASENGDAIQYLTNVGDPDNSLIVVNYGTLSGDVTTTSPSGPGAVYVDNSSGATLAGADLYRADIDNRGRLVVGDGGVSGRTRIAGDFAQDATGTIAVGADFAKGRAGHLTIDGDADLGGGIAVTPTRLVKGAALPVISVTGSTTGSLDTVDTAAVDYATHRTGGTVSVSAEDTRFADAFALLSGNERRVGAHLDRIFDNGSGRYARLLAALDRMSTADDAGIAYASALAALSPGASQAAAAAQSSLARGRLDRAMSCPAFSGATAIVSEESCVWAEFGAAKASQGGDPGYDATNWGFAGGGQVEVRPSWFAGIAVGYINSDYDSSDGLSTADGQSAYLAAALKHEIGAFTIAGGVAGSYGSYDIDRRVRLPGFVGTAEGNSDIYTLSARARLAYTAGTELAYIRPFVDFDLIYTNAGDYTESGAGIYNLDVDDEDQTAFVVTPAVELGARVDLAEDWRARLFAMAGLSLSTEDDWTTSAELVSAPAGTGTFDTTIPIADIVGRVGAGVTLTGPKGFDLRAQYDGTFGDEYWSHSGSLRLTKRF